MRGRRDRGVALVSVLWVSFLLTMIAASIAQTIRVQIQTTHNARSSAIARTMADGVVTLAALDLRELRRDATWRADGRETVYEMPGGRVSVSIWDEGGKIDLNRAAEPLLSSLFIANGVSEEKTWTLVDAIADWRDRDDLTRVNGAEDRDYRQSGLEYGAKDRPFERVAELRRVMGMSNELYRRVAPALTVYSGQRGVDPEVAPPAVLQALPGITEEDVMEASRQKMRGTGRVSRLRDLVSSRRLVSKSRRRNFSIRAVAETSDGAIFVREAVLRLLSRGEDPFQILHWAQGHIDKTAEPDTK